MVEVNCLKMCLKGVKTTEGWIHSLPGGVDLSECDRVHLPVVYEGVSLKEKMERGKKSEKLFLWKERGKDGKGTRVMT